MRLLLEAALRSRTTLVLACAGVVALAYLRLSDELWQVVTLRGVHQSSDSHTHLLRALMARDYYLPSGHHWGWDPFWFQGYVPFLLYPHLTYVGLALFSEAFGTDVARTLNAFSVAAVLAFPLIGGWLMSRDRLGSRLAVAAGGAAGALVLTAWLASVSSDYGGGPQGMFHYGLLNQQVGLCLFVPFSYALVTRLDVRGAGLWLGVIGLAHQHTFLVAGIVWAIIGASLLVTRRVVREAARETHAAAATESMAATGSPAAACPPVREWAVASVLAAAIAAPTLLGLWHGMDNRGAFTGFIHPGMYELLMRGLLVAPWPTLAAVAAAIVGCLFALRTRADAARVGVAAAVGVVLTALSLQLVTTGVDALDPLLRYVLRLRTLGYAVCWWMVLAAVRFATVPRTLQAATVALTVAGIVVGWEHHDALGGRMRQAHLGGRPFQSTSSRAYGALLNDLNKERGQETATVALVWSPKPAFRHPFQRLTHIVRQPALAGHGVELTAVRNAELVYKLESLACDDLRRQIRRHAVGTLVGHSERALRHLAGCIDDDTRLLRRGEWWALRTGVGWHNFHPRVRGFSHDPTWTTLRWRLEPRPNAQRVRLPIAATAPWRAVSDAGPASAERGYDRMLTLVVPPGARTVTLEYAGFFGEWPSVAVSAAALALAVLGRRRARATRRVGSPARGDAPADERACKPARARVL